MNKKPQREERTPAFDDVLKRMLSSPPQPHVKKKSVGKPASKKPAK